MAYTGYIITVYQDCNPYSPTYGQEREERQYDTGECPVQLPANYVQVFTYCEMNSNGSYTGNCVIVYEDVEPLSPTYGDQMETVYTDHVLCEPDSDAPDWEQFGETYCEQIEYQPSGKLGNSGYLVLVEMDMNEYSPTYQQTREDRVQDVVHCTPPNTDPVWVTTRTECELENGVRTGNLLTYKVNTNEYSPDYNFGEEVVFSEQNLTQCPRSASAPRWEEESYVCEFVNGYYTGYATITYRDRNALSDTYNQTKTEYVLDSRCPAQTPSSFPWRIINNRGASTDTITSITLHFNGNFDIQALGSLTPVGGQLNGSVIIPGDLKNTDLVCATIDLSPNTSLPTLFQFSQSPNPYRYFTSMGQDTLIITLWDGDGTGPMWTEVSYTCEQVGGYRTGAAIVVEEDMNPDSSTYGETRTRTIEYDSRCPAQTDANWVETSWTCQQENGYNTGNKLSVQTDTNPNSSTYNQTRTRIIQDLVNCPVDTTADWVEISYTCEQVGGANTGNVVVIERDINPGSSTYNTTRTRTYQDLTRCAIDTEPHWTEESSYCEQGPSSSTYKIWYSTPADTATVPCDSHNYIENSDVTADMVSVSVGDCIEVISDYTFDFTWYSTPKLTHLTMSNSVLEIGESAFWGCHNLTSIVLSDNLEQIGKLAFSYCTSLPTITIPNAIQSIGDSAFQQCTSLESVTVLATTPPTLGQYAFGGTTGYPIYVPADRVSTYKTATGWSYYADRIFAIPNS